MVVTFLKESDDGNSVAGCTPEVRNNENCTSPKHCKSMKKIAVYAGYLEDCDLRVGLFPSCSS